MTDKPQSRMFHLSLNVSDLNRSVEFYKRALGVEPAKHHSDYAKFELSDPPLVLSLEPGRAEGQERLNHLGVRVADGKALQKFAETIHAGGLDPQYLQGVECCYSRQTKLCLTDPDKNLVEFYILEEDLEHSPKTKPTTEAKDTSASVPVAWEHLLGTPFPARLSLEDASQDEVRLRGTFNIKRSPEEIRAILSETRRVLRDTGELMLHLLVSDREITKKLPKLPGPAALVEYTPTETQLVRFLEDSGFQGIHLKRLSHSAVFQFDGAQMRELMLVASPKPNGATGEQQTVVYKGPFRQMTDDHGITYTRGNRTTVSPEVFAALNTRTYADHFVFLNVASPNACAAPAKPLSPQSRISDEVTC